MSRQPEHPQISLLVPFAADKQVPQRLRNWRWLKRYWETELPQAEIVMGKSKGKVFSKTAAVNYAARRARGRILVILDSDCYIQGSVIQECADAIEVAQARGLHLWFIPFRRLYRLTKEITKDIVWSDPKHPLRVTSPPPHDSVESTEGSMHGHHFGAMIQIMPREAFVTVGAMDPRFKGWGGEDIAFLRAVDTLYGKHKTTMNDVLHLWHKNTGSTHQTRMWQGQKKPRSNEHLAQRYNLATGDRVRMRNLVNEGFTDISHGCLECPRWHKT